MFEKNNIESAVYANGHHGISYTFSLRNRGNVANGAKRKRETTILTLRLHSK
jgi:hypothetical protein